MHVVEYSGVTKRFRNTAAVDHLSFTIGQGEIFGMVGPNGAGKTTALRMLMDIIQPDDGEIRVLGEPMNEHVKNRLGYLPEERGLYRKITVAESLLYLAQLKDMRPSLAKERANQLLTRVGMDQHKSKKIEELSRGMSQIIQFIATILHDPDLLVLDEPFSGLDPVNTELLKNLVLELKRNGKSIILSTHMMNQLEELCDRFLMINKGQAVLYGSLDEIKSGFKSNSIFVKCDRIPEGLPGVTGSKSHGRCLELFMDGSASPEEVLTALVTAKVAVDRFEVSTPSLHEIFIRVVKGA
jgi:ABC-2 type transport system ATP-binding protein